MTTLPHTRTAAGQLPVVSLLLSAAAVVIAVIPGAASLLQFDRVAVINDRAVWQTLSCHWTHWSASHLFWDVVAFAVLGGLCECADRRQFVISLGIATIAIPAVLWFTEPRMQTYRGLSGLDSALFALFVVGLIRNAARQGDRVVLLAGGGLFAAFAAKLAFEFLAGQTVFVDSTSSGMVPVPMAHVVGMVIGLVCGINAKTQRCEGAETQEQNSLRLCVFATLR